MDTINLKRKVGIEKYRGILDIGRLQEKESYIAILKLAEENGGKVEAKDIIDKFFKDRPENLGERLIYRCFIYGLLTEDGRLTEEGKAAIEENKVFLKENGAYDIWTTRDPLIPQILLNINEIDVFKMKEGQKAKELLGVPAWLKNLENQKITLFNKKNEVIKIYEFRDLIKEMNNDLNINIYYIISPSGDNKLLITGDLEKNVPDLLPHNYHDVWLSLLGPQSNRWSSDHESFLCYFSEIDEMARSNFKISMTFKSPEILDLGNFDDLIVNNIPISPINNEEANKWALWLLKERITTYLDEEEYGNLSVEIKNLKEFREFNIDLPKQEIMANNFVKINENQEVEFSDKYWFVKAPLDLNPDIIY